MASERIERPADLDSGPVIEPGYNYATVTDKISAIVLKRQTPRGWWIGFIIAFLLAMVLMAAVTWLLYTGIGVWGNNIPVAWAWDITNFVWWVGIGHAGTLISAILLLFRQKWRTSINRFAEAMTLFAVACAASFIVTHMGRPWVAYWPIPLPNQFGSLWVNFNSPLIWDVFAISTFFSVSLVFWYTGLIPDFAVIRDRCKTKWSKRTY